MIAARHFRTGRLGSVDLAVIHTAESACTSEQLGHFFATTDRLASSHAGVDDTGRDTYVSYADTAYCAPGANADGDHLELCGMAAWTRDTWTTKHAGMLEQTALWLAERCKARSLPVVLLGPADLLADRRGITTHAAVTAAFHRSTHTDPGLWLPLASVILPRVRQLLTPKVTLLPSRTVHPRVTAPPFRGLLKVGSRGTAVSTWQRQMRRRGWDIAVDGMFGRASSATCLAFQRQKHLPGGGQVNAVTWTATWAAPVT